LEIKKVGEDVSRVTIIVLLLVTVAVSLVSTWTVVDSVESVRPPTANVISEEPIKGVMQVEAPAEIKYGVRIKVQ
jgi:hypothetical protein